MNWVGGFGGAGWSKKAELPGRKAWLLPPSWLPRTEDGCGVDGWEWVNEGTDPEVGCVPVDVAREGCVLVKGECGVRGYC